MRLSLVWPVHLIDKGEMQNSSVAGTEWQGWSFHKKAVRFQTSVSSIASKGYSILTLTSEQQL